MNPVAYPASTEHRGLCSHVCFRLWVSWYKPLTVCLGTCHLSPAYSGAFLSFFGIKDNPSTMGLRLPSLVKGCVVICQVPEQPEYRPLSKVWKSLFSFLPNTCLGKSLPLLPFPSSRAPFISLDPVAIVFFPKAALLAQSQGRLSIFLTHQLMLAEQAH